MGKPRQGVLLRLSAWPPGTGLRRGPCRARTLQPRAKAASKRAQHMPRHKCSQGESGRYLRSPSGSRFVPPFWIGRVALGLPRFEEALWGGAALFDGAACGGGAAAWVPCVSDVPAASTGGGGAAFAIATSVAGSVWSGPSEDALAEGDAAGP